MKWAAIRAMRKYVMRKGSTVRLDDDQAEELEAVAKVDGLSVTEAVLDTPAEDLAHASRLELADSTLHIRSTTIR